MNLPRWTAYLALAVVGVVLLTAIPKKGEASPSEGAAEAARAGKPVETKYPRMVVLGIDGLDPDILKRVIADHPGKMPHFEELIAEADGVVDLGTSTPPQSPVAWSNFIVGMNPGGHGIFDFVHRDPEEYGPLAGTITKASAGSYWLPGQWKFPTSEGGDANRSGKAFWTILGENGVPADVWRMPINFPVEASKKGWSFPGMMTPAVDSSYGEASLYSTDPAVVGDKVFSINLRDGVVKTKLLGPSNAFKEGDPRTEVPFEIYADEENDVAVVDIAGSTLVLEPGEWSTFVRVSYDMLPMGIGAQGGIVRFYLRSVSPKLELYASPVNVDPTSPINPVSSPDSAAQKLAERIGLYYTQGMAEDVNALKAEMLTDAEFMRQAQLVYQERGAMLEMALDKYMKNEEGGFLFFYYSSVDLCCHMMWRHQDEQHPNYDPKVAGEDSTWWSGRAGTTWHDVVDDLYIRMDEVLGDIRKSVGKDTTIVVMSDHGFAPYRRKFSLNTWLHDNGYLVFKEGFGKEQPLDHAEYKPIHIYDRKDGEYTVDWSKTKAFGMGFNGLYLNLAGREAHGSVKASEKGDLIKKLKAGLEEIYDGEVQVVTAADIATEVYSGDRVKDAPDILVGYNSGYGNSDEASLGRVTAEVLSDNLGGTFNGSHLMDPEHVKGTILSNRPLGNPDPRLEDLTVEILRYYGIKPAPDMVGKPVFKN
ncbi:MAG: alkaline phosphatase family protein [Planctomycetota bacterium]|nr:alkaline phosphatase family protein [Planctomycetota bacterium]